MIRLRTLGGFCIHVDEDGADSPNVRPRHCALLAFLAGHGHTGVGRDKVLGYLWPDSDTPRARNSLKQALFFLRQSFRHPLVICTSGLLRLDPTGVDADVWRFEEALANGREAEAAALYEGPFMEGFYVNGLDEFERWVETERHRLARRQIGALRALAGRSASRADLSAAVHWWRCAAETEPLCSSIAQGLMRALMADGDLSGALRHAREHAALVKAELGEPVGEGVVRLAEEARCQLERAPPPLLRVVSMPPARLRPPHGERPSPTVGAHVVTPPPARPLELVHAPRWSVLVTVAALGVAVVADPGGPPEPAPAPASRSEATFTILPFQVSGGPESSEVADGIGELLAARLDGADGLRAASAGGSLTHDPAHRLESLLSAGPAATARRYGARFYVVGRLVRTAAHLQVTATMHDRGNANSVVARAEAEGEDLFDLADAFAGQLIAGRYRGPDERLTQVAVASTRSLPALKAYLEGERHLRAHRERQAMDAFRRAVRADTAYALAYYRLSVAADREGDEAQARWATDLAARFSDRLADHDRRLVEAALAARRGTVDEAERIYRALVADFPDDAEPWFRLGELLLHRNPLVGRPAFASRPAFERSLALDSDNDDAMIHLARVAALEGDSAGAEAWISKALAASADTTGLELRAIRAFALVGLPAAWAVSLDHPGQPGQPVDLDLLAAAVHTGEPDATERLGRALGVQSQLRDVRLIGLEMLASALIARGHFDAAQAELARAGELDGAEVVELRAVLAVETAGRAKPDQLRQLRAAAESLVRRGEPMGTFALGLVALQAGETSTVRRMADRLGGLQGTTSTEDLETRHGTLGWALSHSLRARIALAEGKKSLALEFLRRARWDHVQGGSWVKPRDRYLRAELVRELGRAEEAIGWYHSIAEGAFGGLVYLAPSELRLGQLYDEKGEFEKAVHHYRRFVRLWEHCDASLEPMRRQVEGRLARIASRGGESPSQSVANRGMESRGTERAGGAR